MTLEELSEIVCEMRYAQSIRDTQRTAANQARVEVYEWIVDRMVGRIVLPAPILTTNIGDT